MAIEDCFDLAPDDSLSKLSPEATERVTALRSGGSRPPSQLNQSSIQIDLQNVAVTSLHDFNAKTQERGTTGVERGDELKDYDENSAGKSIKFLKTFSAIQAAN